MWCLQRPTPAIDMTLAQLNATDLEGFVDTLAPIFEGSAWVAERSWARRPFSTLEDVHTVMTSIVESASNDEQLALLRAHPELGAVRFGASAEATAGLAKARPNSASDGGQADANISQASRREQAAAGIDALTPDQFERLRALNAAYREKYGFPFLFAVKGSTTQDILAALERRLASTRDAERREALRQVYRIARFRLEEVIS
jgi:2-oxo-4-hydroxy-4-carboxy-5-ureidoimidazoline decarboxylase